MMANAPADKKKAGPAAPPSWRDELDLVRRPLTFFLTALGAAVIAVGVSSWFRADQDINLAQASGVREVAVSKFKNVELEKQEIKIYQPRFIELKSAGLIGDENRLAWIEAVKQIQAERKLLSVSYDVEPQQPLVMARALALGEYQLRGSRMRVKLGVLHELDVFNFIDDLRSAGLFTVQDCKLKRAETPQDATNTPRVTAECTLVWVTLGVAPAAPAGPPVAPVAKKGWR